MMGVGIVVHSLTVPISFVNIKVIVQTRVGQKRDISRSGNTWGLKKPGLGGRSVEWRCGKGGIGKCV